MTIAGGLQFFPTATGACGAFGWRCVCEVLPSPLAPPPSQPPPPPFDTQADGRRRFPPRVDHTALGVFNSLPPPDCNAGPGSPPRVGCVGVPRAAARSVPRAYTSHAVAHAERAQLSAGAPYVGYSGGTALMRLGLALTQDQMFGLGNAPASTISSDHFTSSVELCDVDGDGDLDLVFFVWRHSSNGAACDSESNPHADNHYELHINDGSGAYSRSTSFPQGNSSGVAVAVACGDVDGDGDVDIVFGRRASFSSAANGENGGRANELLINDGTGGFSVDPSFPGGNGTTSSLAFGDVDSGVCQVGARTPDQPHLRLVGCNSRPRPPTVRDPCWCRRRSRPDRWQRLGLLRRDVLLQSGQCQSDIQRSQRAPHQ